jgi:asparagine synthase (glutamine-hydrolysing)
MNNKILLNNNLAYEWYSLNECHVKGYAFDSDGQCLYGSNLASKFSGVDSLSNFEAVVKGFNGVFSVVVNTPLAAYLCVDITRTIPLFYAKYDEGWVVSDDTNSLGGREGGAHCMDAIDEFVSTGFVTGSKTLLNNIAQVQAAEVVELSHESVQSREYWTYASNLTAADTLPELQKKLLQIYENLAKRLMEIAGGRTIVVPLSGGYDSRLVLALLVKYGYHNLHCFTYGVKSSFEVSIAKKIAAKLGVKLEVVEYSDAFVDEFFCQGEFFEYLRFGANHVSLSHVQDFLAVKYLRVNKLVPDNALFAPGHSGDIFAGTHISKNITEDSTPDEVIKEIQRKHFSLNKGSRSEILYFDSSCFPYSNMEAWSWKERQSKFIVNSLRVYDFFGYQSALPLWDKELANFFKSIRLDLKNRNFDGGYSIEKNLYDSTCFIIFRSLDVAIMKQVGVPFFEKVIARIRLALNIQRDEINNFDYFVQKSETSLSISGNGCVNSRLVNIACTVLGVFEH